MMPEILIWISAGLAGLWVLSITCLLLCYRKTAQGQAIICSGYNGIRVSFSGKIVIPILQEAQYLDITLKRLMIDRQGNDALVCEDSTKANVKAAFFVRVNPTAEDVKKVVQKLGIEKAADVETLASLFTASFSESLQTVAKANTFEQLSEREYFKSEVMKTIGNDLDGYILDTVAIDYLEKTQTT